MNINNLLAAATAAAALTIMPTTAHADEVPTTCTIEVHDTPAVYSSLYDSTGIATHTTIVTCPGSDPVTSTFNYTVHREVSQPTRRTPSLIMPCREEDGSGQRVCFWDAHARGNHIGRSFITMHQAGMTFTKYITARRAHRLTESVR